MCVCVCVCVCIKRVRERLQRAANLILNDPAGFAVGERERERESGRDVSSPPVEKEEEEEEEEEGGKRNGY